MVLDFIEILKVIFLGIVEGITEWLPISSTGHMILVDEFITLNMSEAFKEMFFVVIQLGAILAVVVMFWNKMFPFQFKNKAQFDSRWKRLEVEYCDAGMSEEQIAAMKEYDWAWFCSQRVFQNHTQPIPCEQYDEVCGQSQLFRKFASLSYQWDVDKIDQTRYGWLASVENEQLLLRLKKLSKKDLELLTLLFVDGYGLTAPKKRNPKSSAKNPGDSANGKEKEIDEG